MSTRVRAHNPGRCDCFARMAKLSPLHPRPSVQYITYIQRPPIQRLDLLNPGMDKFSMLAVLCNCPQFAQCCKDIITFSLHGNLWLVPSRSFFSQNRIIMFALVCLRLCLIPANAKPTAWLSSRPFRTYLRDLWVVEPSSCNAFPAYSLSRGN